MLEGCSLSLHESAASPCSCRQAEVSDVSWWTKTSKVRWTESTEEERTNGGDGGDKSQKEEDGRTSGSSWSLLITMQKKLSRKENCYTSKSNGLWRAAKEKEISLEALEKQLMTNSRNEKDTSEKTLPYLALPSVLCCLVQGFSFVCLFFQQKGTKVSNINFSWFVYICTTCCWVYVK